MKIDWKARLTNKTWWIAVISVVLLIAQYFGFDLTKYIGQDWQTLITLIFALIALLGITVDTRKVRIAVVLFDILINLLNKFF